MVTGCREPFADQPAIRHPVRARYYERCEHPAAQIGFLADFSRRATLRPTLGLPVGLVIQRLFFFLVFRG